MNLESTSLLLKLHFFKENKNQLELMWTLCYELNESVLGFEQDHFYHINLGRDLV